MYWRNNLQKSRVTLQLWKHHLAAQLTENKAGFARMETLFLAPQTNVIVVAVSCMDNSYMGFGVFEHNNQVAPI